MRHGQSTFNVGYDQTGRDPQIPDAPLSEKGYVQVEKAARQIRKGTIDMIVSSPYSRALQTAKIVAEIHSVPVVVEPLVGERRLYSCDIGSPVDALRATWPDLDFGKVDKEPWWLPMPESHSDLLARIRTFKDQWAFEEVRDRLLVVSHWYFINGATGVSPDNAEIVACSV